MREFHIFRGGSWTSESAGDGGGCHGGCCPAGVAMTRNWDVDEGLENKVKDCDENLQSLD